MLTNSSALTADDEEKKDRYIPLLTIGKQDFVKYYYED